MTAIHTRRSDHGLDPSEYGHDDRAHQGDGHEDFDQRVTAVAIWSMAVNRLVLHA